MGIMWCCRSCRAGGGGSKRRCGAVGSAEDKSVSIVGRQYGSMVEVDIIVVFAVSSQKRVTRTGAL